MEGYVYSLLDVHYIFLSESDHLMYVFTQIGNPYFLVTLEKNNFVATDGFDFYLLIVQLGFGW